MPELPEVEVTRRGLLEQLPGRTIIQISWSAFRLRTEIPRQFLKDHIDQQQILTIDRRAKYLLIRMKSGATLVIHLGMTGKLGLLPEETARHKHDHLVLGLDNAMELRFNDSRRFGSIAVWPAMQAMERECEFSSREGIEPFDNDFTAEHLLRLAKSRQIPVKSFLMNTRLVAGIGNIYANEALFMAGILPSRQAGSISLSRYEKLADCIRIILRHAILQGGTTLKDFVNEVGKPGYFQQQLCVYGRANLPCINCLQPLTEIRMANRTTVFCKTCQH